MRFDIKKILLFLFATLLILNSADALSKPVRMVQPAPKKPGTEQVQKALPQQEDTAPATASSPSIVSNAQNKTPDVTKPAAPVRKNTKVTAPSGRAISASLVTKDLTVRKRTLTMGKNDSFIGMLAKLGFNQRQVSSLTTRLAREAGFLATSATTGQQLIVTEKVEGNKRKILAIQIPAAKYTVNISKNPAGYVQISKTVRQDAPAAEKSRYFYKTGAIQTTIAAFSVSNNVPTSVSDKAIRVISGKVNTSQIKRGDRIEILYEYTYNNAGQQTGLRLLYVSLVSRGVRTEGYRFSPDGKDTGEFFDTEGNSFTKSMLSSPLRGRHKISSPFGYRMHPILGRRLLHTGVDFSAKRGELVYAAGDGTIDKLGRFGGYGNFIRIKHDGTWSTAYAHLSGFARGQTLWKRVKKGELIGYVGNTGRSTGPHLHFELQKMGTPIDPLKAKLPVGGKKLIAKDLYNFRQETRRMKDIIVNKAVR